ncbi:hypothetical protein ACGFYY_25315 [Streptomyces sp. NPDC048331]|uniref:hypothetical protein n=1 Tax=Streptomyces sp. NPDC048331 TaxID=3365534 RepID=UPI003719FE88
MAFETTYEAFLARATAQRGAEEAQAICLPYARTFARNAREMAASAAPDDAAQLLRLAAQMDPDLRQEGIS